MFCALSGGADVLCCAGHMFDGSRAAPQCISNAAQALHMPDIELRRLARAVLCRARR